MNGCKMFHASQSLFYSLVPVINGTSVRETRESRRKWIYSNTSYLDLAYISELPYPG